ncbi:hypothetical protein ACU686_06900 [Yinghuangia aomiensis]
MDELPRTTRAWSTGDCGGVHEGQQANSPATHAVCGPRRRGCRPRARRGPLGVMAVAVRREGDEVAGLDKLLILAAVLTAGLAALCAGSIFAVRDTLRDGFGALGRAATWA